MIAYITDPTKYGVPTAELEEIALTNLRRMTKGGLEKLDGGLYVGQWNDEYAAERMLLPELWAELDFKGDPVVFLPGCERIIVADSKDDEMLVAALMLVKDRMSRPRGLVDFGFVLRGGKWQLFEDEGIGRLFADGVALHLADAYAPQKEHLEKKHEGDQNAPFVASVMGLGDKETGELAMTIATWPKDVHALLPRVNRIALGELEKPDEVAMVPWADVMAEIGNMLVPVPDMFPPRWEVKSFPDEATIATLRAKANAADEPAKDAKVPSSMRRPAGGALPGKKRSLVPLLLLGVVCAIVLVIALTR